MDIGVYGIIALAAAGFLTGVAKNGVPGLVTVVTPFVAMVIPARTATGMLLPLLVTGDITAVIFWRKKTVWKQLFRLFPWTLGGIVSGFFVMRAVDDATFRPILGAIIIAMTLLGLLRKRYNLRISPDNKPLVAIVGFLAGMFTLMANAAAPLLAMYFLSLNLDKEELVGTNAWFFFVVNLIRVPFTIGLGVLTLDRFLVDLMLVPLVLAGAYVGSKFLKKIPLKTFAWITEGLALVAGIRLIF